jgi:uncharacterized protein YggE
MTRTNLAVIIAALSLHGMMRPACAQFFPSAPSSPANIEGFTVTGKGFAAAKPNRLEIEMEVSAASELTADAIVKYRDAKRRLQEAFAALKLENVTVEEQGLLVDQKGPDFNPYYFYDQMTRKAKVEVQLTRKLVVKCSNISKMDEDAVLEMVAKLLDVAQDSGGKVGGSANPRYNYFYGYMPGGSGGLVRFILDDYDKLEEEACAKAIADAEARARRLAKLSHVKLGPVTAVRDVTPPTQRELVPDENVPHKRLESPRFQEIQLRVELAVRFDTTADAGASGKVGNK